MHQLTNLLLLAIGVLAILPQFTELPAAIHRQLQTWVGYAALAWGLWGLLHWLSHFWWVFHWPLWMGLNLISALVLIGLGLALAQTHFGTPGRRPNPIDTALQKLGPQPLLVLGIAALVLWVVRILIGW